MAEISKLAVVAVGGNALIRDKDHLSIADQFEEASVTARHIADMIEAGWVKLATTLQKGERVRLIAGKSEGIHEVLEVEADRFRTGFAAEDGEVFVYGREVQDFRKVDYEAISMLNVSATQELARQLEAKDAEIARLAEKVAALEARDQTREARLTRLENALDQRPARTVSAALDLE